MILFIFGSLGIIMQTFAVVVIVEIVNERAKVCYLMHISLLSRFVFFFLFKHVKK